MLGQVGRREIRREREARLGKERTGRQRGREGGREGEGGRERAREKERERERARQERPTWLTMGRIRQAVKSAALAAALLASIRAGSVPDLGAELNNLLSPLLGKNAEQASGPSVPLVATGGLGATGPTTGSWLGGPSNGQAPFL